MHRSTTRRSPITARAVEAPKDDNTDKPFRQGSRLSNDRFVR